jgi:hypothetical protein
MVKAKTFIEAINSFYDCKRKFKTYLLDNRLTTLEKKILQCMIWISDSKFDEVIGALEDTTPLGDKIIDAEKELLMGMAFNNRGDSKKAVPFFKRSITLMADSPLKRRLFTANCNLFFCYYNLKSNDGMKSALEAMVPFEEMTTAERITLLSTKLCYSSVINDFDNSLLIINELKKHQHEMNDNHKSGFLLDQFDYYFKTDQYQKCYMILEQMTRIKKFHLGANYKFMKGILNNLTTNSPLYLYENNFTDHPLLLFQIRVLKALEEKQTGEALKGWEKLREFSPLVYQPNFHYSGDKCLFGECLKKHLLAINTPPVQATIDSAQFSNKIQFLLSILEESKGPILKEALYEKIYGKPITDKEDLKKLAQLIYKVRLSHDVEIKTRKGCYFIEVKAA